MTLKTMPIHLIAKPIALDVYSPVMPSKINQNATRYNTTLADSPGLINRINPKMMYKIAVMINNASFFPVSDLFLKNPMPADMPLARIPTAKMIAALSKVVSGLFNK